MFEASGGNMKIKKTSIPALLFLVPLTSGASAAEMWDMPTAYPASNFQTINAQEFSTCVSTGTSGDITILLHPNGSLFKGNDIKRAVQTGQTQIGERLLSSHENENPIFGTDSIPFIATNYEDSVKLYESARPELDRVLDGQGLKLLYSVPWPPNGLYFNKDVNSIADMAGNKVRAYNKVSARIATLTGMTPVSLEAAEISQGMAAGVINSLMTSSVTGKDSKVWEQLNHFYQVKAWLPRNYVIVNKAVWTSLPKEKQDVLVDCSTKAEIAGLEKSKVADDEALAALKSNGVQVLAPSEVLTTELAKIGETIATEWVTKAGEVGSNILAQFKQPK
jgi:TRAP-type C4-dicarboxylate transport system substrate-binding protein